MFVLAILASAFPRLKPRTRQRAVNALVAVGGATGRSRFTLRASLSLGFGALGRRVPGLALENTALTSRVLLITALIPTFTHQEFAANSWRRGGRGVALCVGPKLGRPVLALVCENKMALHDVEEALVALGRVVLLEAPVRHDFFLECRRLDHLFQQDLGQELFIRLFDHPGNSTIPVVAEPFNLLVAVAASSHCRKVSDVMSVAHAVIGAEVFVHGEQLLTSRQQALILPQIPAFSNAELPRKLPREDLTQGGSQLPVQRAEPITRLL